MNVYIVDGVDGLIKPFKTLKKAYDYIVNFTTPNSIYPISKIKKDLAEGDTYDQHTVMVTTPDWHSDWRIHKTTMG